MRTLQEIEKRMAEIAIAIDADGADIDALSQEVDTLKEEKRGLTEQLEKRKKLLDSIASGKTPGNTIAIYNKEERKEKNFNIDSVEFRNAWLKNLQGKELDVEERTAITASTVIPTLTLNKVVEKLEQTSALYSKITVLNIPGNVSIPVENAKNDASWVAMGSASTDSADTFTNISLSAYKLIKTIEISADVMAMSIDAFESFIVNALYKKLAKAVENAILNGTGSAQPTGLLKAGEITTTTTFTKAAMTYKDLMKIIAQLGTEYLQNAGFTMPRALFFSDVLGMETATGERVVVADAQSPAKFNILGYPVILADDCTTDKLIFGDWSYYYWNWAKAVEITSDGSVGFRSGSTVFRAMALADGRRTVDEAFCTATRALS